MTCAHVTTLLSFAAVETFANTTCLSTHVPVENSKTPESASCLHRPCPAFLQAQLQQKYLQPVAKTKVYSKEEAKEQAARIQRLVEGLGAFEKSQ